MARRVASRSLLVARRLLTGASFAAENIIPPPTIRSLGIFNRIWLDATMVTAEADFYGRFAV